MMGAIITLASGGCGAIGAAAIGSGVAAAFEPNREMALSHPPSPRAAAIMTMVSARGRCSRRAAAASIVLTAKSPVHRLFPAKPVADVQTLRRMTRDRYSPQRLP